MPPQEGGFFRGNLIGNDDEADFGVRVPCEQGFPCEALRGFPFKGIGDKVTMDGLGCFIF